MVPVVVVDDVEAAEEVEMRFFLKIFALAGTTMAGVAAHDLDDLTEVVVAANFDLAARDREKAFGRKIRKMSGKLKVEERE